MLLTPYIYKHKRRMHYHIKGGEIVKCYCKHAKYRNHMLTPNAWRRLRLRRLAPIARRA